MSNYVIVAETGADIPKELASKYQIHIVPMHVSFGDESKPDMTFPVEDVFAFYDKTGTLPKTSGSTPHDFNVAFDEIHAAHPDKHILYLAYSAVTTVSYASAQIAAKDRPYVTSIDTKCVSAGQAYLVCAVAQYIEENPKAPLDEVKALVDDYISRSHMGFFPGDLVYLKAGGRVSNAAYLGAKMLRLNPLIEIINGELISDKKYRGKTLDVAPKLVRDYTEKHNLDKEVLWFLYSGKLNEDLKKVAEQTAHECGYPNTDWVQTGCVVSTHAGPGAFGVVGFSA